jgi:hypothetical protein
MSQRRRCSSTATTSNSSSTAEAAKGGVVLNRWVLYLSLVVLRFISINQRGYIHPDEFFQGGQELFFGTQRSDDNTSSSTRSSSSISISEYMVTNVPWEYQPIHAVRSIIPPAFMTLIPIHIYTAIIHHYYYYHKDENKKEKYYNNKQLSGKEILLIPRLFMTILSIIFLDGSLWLLVYCRNAQQQKQQHTATTTKLQKQQQQQQQQTIATLSPPIEVIILASSWPCLVLSTRPFTNSLETMSLAILLVITVRILRTTTTTHEDNNTSYYYSILPLLLMGVTCSIGIFIRFTFAFFAFPSVIIFFYHRWKRKLNSNSSSTSNTLVGDGYRLQSLLLSLLQHVLYDGIWIIVSFALVSYIFIYIDTQYYTSSSLSNVNSFLNWNDEDYNNDNNNDNNTTCSIFSCPSSSSSQSHQQPLFSRSMSNYITPINALLYNSKQDNLALHGLHSRITHIGECNVLFAFIYTGLWSTYINLSIGQYNRFMYYIYEGNGFISSIPINSYIYYFSFFSFSLSA